MTPQTGKIHTHVARRGGSPPSQRPPADALPLRSARLRTHRFGSRRWIGGVLLGALTCSALAALASIQPGPAADAVPALRRTVADPVVVVGTEPMPTTPAPEIRTNDLDLRAGSEAELVQELRPTIASQAVGQTTGGMSQTSATEPAEIGPAETSATRPRSVEALSPEDAGVYLRKGEEKAKAGDLAAARLYFERVARSGDPRGAIGMARTFDPEVLAKLPVVGLRPEPETARSWYKRAESLQAAL